jgi:hypothetical protein
LPQLSTPLLSNTNQWNPDPNWPVVWLKKFCMTPVYAKTSGGQFSLASGSRSFLFPSSIVTPSGVRQRYNDAFPQHRLQGFGLLHARIDRLGSDPIHHHDLAAAALIDDLAVFCGQIMGPHLPFSCIGSRSRAGSEQEKTEQCG